VHDLCTIAAERAQRGCGADWEITRFTGHWAGIPPEAVWLAKSHVGGVILTPMAGPWKGAANDPGAYWRRLCPSEQAEYDTVQDELRREGPTCGGAPSGRSDLFAGDEEIEPDAANKPSFRL